MRTRDWLAPAAAMVLAGGAMLASGFGGKAGAIILAAGSAVILLAAVFPGFRASYVAATRAAARAVGLLVTVVLLGAVFICVFVPGRLVMAAFGGDPLRKGFPGGASTEWSKPRPRRGGYRRQFS